MSDDIHSLLVKNYLVKNNLYKRLVIILVHTVTITVKQHNTIKQVK